MMSKILIISATKGTNHVLANKIGDFVNLKHEIISLEDFNIPLYIPKIELPNKDSIEHLSKKFIQSDGFIFCAPEYNGGSPPILANTITWLSVITNNWRDVFLNKKALIATIVVVLGSGFYLHLEYNWSIWVQLFFLEILL